MRKIRQAIALFAIVLVVFSFSAAISFAHEDEEELALGKQLVDSKVSCSDLDDENLEINKEDIIKEFDRIYLAETMKKEKLLVDKKLLETLSRQFRLGIVTGRPRRDAELGLKRFGIRKFFDTVVTLDDVSKSKPDPEGLLKATGLLSSANAAYFGDSVDDMAAATKAGATGIGIMPPKPSGSVQGALLESGAKLVLDNINNLEVI